MEEPRELHELLEAYARTIERGLEDENWISTVMAALTLPDFCSSLEKKKGRGEYIKWFDTYVTVYQNPCSDIKGGSAYFNGVNAYALRCSILHNGDGEIGNQDIYKKGRYKYLTLGTNKVKFETITSGLGYSQYEDTAIMNPKVFCEAILQGFYKWINENKDNEEVIGNAEELVVFEWIHI